MRCSLRTSSCSATTPGACTLSSLYVFCRDEVQPQDQLLLSYDAWSLHPASSCALFTFSLRDAASEHVLHSFASRLHLPRPFFRHPPQVRPAPACEQYCSTNAGFAVPAGPPACSSGWDV